MVEPILSFSSHYSRTSIHGSLKLNQITKFFFLISGTSLCWRDRKMFLTGCMSYVSGKQDVHLCLKQIKHSGNATWTAWLACQKEKWPQRLHECLENHIMTEDFQPQGREWRTGRKVTRHHITLGAGLLPNDLGFRRERFEQYKTS